MPSITIRFQWDDDYSEVDQARSLRELSAHLRARTIEAFSADGEELYGFDGALVEEDSVDAVIDDGRGITHADREQAAIDDEHEARAQARAEEVTP